MHGSCDMSVWGVTCICWCDMCVGVVTCGCVVTCVWGLWHECGDCELCVVDMVCVPGLL